MSISMLRYFAGFTSGFLVCNVNPQGRGRLQFPGGDLKIGAPSFNDIGSYCNEYPEASLNSSDADKERLRIGIQVARKLLEAACSARRGAFIELIPGPLFSSSSSMFRFYMNAFSGSYYHPCGSCAMSTKLGSGVVDEELRVRGVKGLRVADASVFPHILTGPISAVCMAIGLKAADLMTSGHCQ